MTVKDIDPNILKNHPLQIRIYGDVADDDFCDEIETFGVLQPLLITRDRVVIAGHRRMQAARKRGLKTVPCVETALTDELDIELAFLSTNKNREKTNEQKAKEVRERLRIETARAEVREKAGKRAPEPCGTSSTGSENTENTASEPCGTSSTGSVKGKSRDIAGAEVGWSGKTAEKAVEVADAIDEAVAEGDTATAEELRETLNEKGVAAAYRKATEEEEPASDLRDPTGEKVLKPHREAFTIGAELGNVVSAIGRLESKVTDILQDSSGLGDLKTATVLDHLNKAKQHISLHRPWTRCPKCDPKEPKKNCVRCKGRGWIDHLEHGQP